MIPNSEIITHRLSATEISFDPTITSKEEAAFTSGEFQRLINAGLQRVEKIGAESGFSVNTRDDKIIYSPLIYGTGFIEKRDWGDENAIPIGYSDRVAQTAGGHSWGDEDLMGPLLDSHRFAFFHYHPDYAPYSSTDIESYDAEGDTELSQDFRYQGLLMPKKQWTGKKYQMTSVTLFMYGSLGGRPSSNEYQGANFNRLPLKQQAELLERCGFRVILLDFPVTDNKVDITSLEELFKKSSTEVSAQ